LAGQIGILAIIFYLDVLQILNLLDMYTVIILILLFLGIRFIYAGTKKNRRPGIIAGALVIALTAVFFWFMSFWGEKLWYDSLGFGQRFWIEIGTKAGLILAGVLLSGFLVFLFTSAIDRRNAFFRYLGLGIALLFGGIWGHSNWEVILTFFNSVDSGTIEPILNHDASFYMFILPFYKEMITFFLVVLIISIAAMLLSLYSQDSQQGEVTLEEMNYQGVKIGRTLVIAGSIFFIVLGLQKFIARYDLLFSDWGAVSGPGWTDVHVRLPGYTISALLTLLVGLIFFLPLFRRRLIRYLKRFRMQHYNLVPGLFGSLFGVILLVWLLFIVIIPGAFQGLVVEHNAISKEKPYIKNNIDLTRQAFDLGDIEEKQYPMTQQFTRQTVEENQSVFSNIRLWDWSALLQVYNQFQEIRLYYEFEDVDIDRYTFNNEYQQVMVSAREMELNNLPENSQTFVNRRFKYTHGYGITLTKVNEFTQNGLPNMLVKDIPPVSKYPELEVKQPQIYYGEATRTHVVANSANEEFDYPSG